MEWIEFTLAMALFLASHRIPAAFGLKGRLVALLGPRGYTVVFSLASVALLWWLIVAADRAPVVHLWFQAPWQRWLVNIAMPVAVVLTVYGVAAPNPFAFEGRAGGFDPARPGIAGVTRQPLLWALGLWAGAHLVANGDLAHVLLFGVFVLLAIAGVPLVEGRRRRQMGAAQWQQLTAHTGLIPLAALLTGHWRPQAAPNWWRLALAVVIWVGTLHLHEPVIGPSPLP